MHGGNETAMFAAAEQALAQDQPLQAKAITSGILSRARAGGNLLEQARAFSLLGRIEHLNADLHRAMHLFQQAAHLFHVLDAPQEEASTLSHVAHVATLLGLTEEAVESAALAVHLVERLPPDARTVEAYNYLGLAAIFVDAQHADRALCRAIDLAAQIRLPLLAARPMANQLFNELYRLELSLQRGRQERPRPAIEAQLLQYEKLVTTGMQTDKPGDASRFTPSMRLATLHTARAGLLAHAGEPDRALEAAARICHDGVPRWMGGFLYFVQTRCHLAAGQWTQALARTEDTLEVARAQGQIHFVLLAHYQRLEALAALGDAPTMLAEFHAFRDQQMQLQTEVIHNRERVAALHLAWREQARALEALHTSARALERLAREDPLTGLANRRAFQQQLDEAMAQPATERGQPWCLVMIDIDGFKQINDTCTHVVGDEVLRQMATLLRAVVREQDLAVRLAGDEFVLVLRDTEECTGQQVLARLSAAIERHPWSDLHPGLAVRASMGLTQAMPHDTCTSLLRRSDQRMYADKAGKLLRDFDSRFSQAARPAALPDSSLA